MGRLDSHVDSQIELSKIFFNSFIGFHYYTELHQKSFKEERKKEKDIYTQRGKHVRDQRTHARCRPRKLKEKKKSSLKSRKYIKISA